LLSLVLTAGFVVGLFMEPAESRANLTAGWQGEYFSNMALEGDPVIVDTDDVIEMNWFTAAPYENMPADYFSVRWTSTASFADGIYRFRVGADDGIRLLIDNKLVIDAYEVGTFRTITRDVRLRSGEHLLQVEYFEETGFAGVLVDWSITEEASEVIDLETERIDVVEADTPPMARIRGTGGIVYDRPHIYATRLTNILLYQQFTVIGISEDGNWLEVALQNDTSGWVQRQDVAVTHQERLPLLETPTDAETPPIEFVGSAQANLNLLDNPHSDTRVGTIPLEQEFEIIGRDAVGNWLLVRWENDEQLDTLQGWVFAPYVRITSGRLLDITIR
jgi:hypothetical protein